MQQADANLALTDAARRIASQKDLPLRRRVRYVSGLDHDVEVHRKDQFIYLNRDLDSASAASALEQGVKQAARIDFGALTPADIARLTQQKQEHVEKLVYLVYKRTKERRFDEARATIPELQRAINMLEDHIKTTASEVT